MKNLALSGFRHIEVIDMDTIELSNLNRQFLFRRSDEGQAKSTTAAKFVNSRVPGANVIAHFGRLEEKDEDYYRSFDVVIAGLDSIDARRWLNATLVGLVETDEEGNCTDPSTIVPLIDGGTEGFSGQARVILGRLTCCFECNISLFPPQLNFPVCTIANTPRLPEHCIEWASTLAWPEKWGDKRLDPDDPEHMKWVFEKASARAGEYGIAGVTPMLALGVVKRIIPAVASTNAIIAAACVNEAVKLCTNSAIFMQNYMTYNGNAGVYSNVIAWEKNPDCPVCGTGGARAYPVGKSELFGDVLATWKDNPDLRTAKPSVRCNGKSIYMAAPDFLEKQTRGSLEKRMEELFSEGDILIVTDPSLPASRSLMLKIVWK